jgi:hypothetical protein
MPPRTRLDGGTNATELAAAYPPYPERDCSLFGAASVDPCWRHLASECLSQNGGLLVAVVTEAEASWPRHGSCRVGDPDDSGVTTVFVVPADDRGNGLGELALHMSLSADEGDGHLLRTSLGSNPDRSWLPDGGRVFGTVFCGICELRVARTSDGWRAVEVLGMGRDMAAPRGRAPAPLLYAPVDPRRVKP